VLPPLTAGQGGTVSKAAKQVNQQARLAKQFDRADNRKQKRELKDKDKKLDKQAKETIKDWRQEGLPTKASQPGATEPAPLHGLFETVQLLVGESLLWWADCLGGGGGGYCDDIPCNPECAAHTVGGVGYRPLGIRP
jgi:hypothetical protein